MREAAVRSINSCSSKPIDYGFRLLLWITLSLMLYFVVFFKLFSNLSLSYAVDSAQPLFGSIRSGVKLQ